MDWYVSWAVVAVLCLSLPAGATAAPFVPADDTEVLERLPASPLDPAGREISRLHALLSERPADVETATRLAQRYIDQGRALSDPRYYGRAQAALAHWWEQATPPLAVLMLRATIRQHHHEFPAALTDLEQVIRTDPNDAQAWLTRATILQVRGEYEEAKRSCVPLLRLAAPLLGTTCVSSAGSLSGAARKSSEVLARTLERSAERTAAVRRWALTVLAETAARLGDDQLARRHFSEALALGGRDEYLLGAYADFLLDHDQPEAVLSLLKGETPADALLLRVAIAEHRLGDPAFAAHRDLLRARFAANRQRGTPVHLREEARFTLECENDAARALPMAQENWSVQKEPWDARVLLEAAAATGARAAAQPVLDFLARWSVEDVSLSRLAAQLEPPRS